MMAAKSHASVEDTAADINEGVDMNQRQRSRDIRRYYCQFCGICRSKKKLLRSHILTNHKDELDNAQSDEVDHVNMLDGRVQHTCKECGASFRKPTHLKQHIQSHSIEVSNLRQHIKAIHQNLRPFSCKFSECGKAFSYKHVRDNHEKSGVHSYIQGDFLEIDEQRRSRPRGGRKRKCPSIGSLCGKRIVLPEQVSILDNGVEYLGWLLSGEQ